MENKYDWGSPIQICIDKAKEELILNRANQPRWRGYEETYGSNVLFVYEFSSAHVRLSRASGHTTAIAKNAKNYDLVVSIHGLKHNPRFSGRNYCTPETLEQKLRGNRTFFETVWVDDASFLSKQQQLDLIYNVMISIVPGNKPYFMFIG